MVVAYRADRAASLGCNPVGRRGAPGKGAPGAPGDMPGLGSHLPSRGFRRRQGMAEGETGETPVYRRVHQPAFGRKCCVFLVS